MPYTVSPEERLDQATQLMQAFHIRHLPVVTEGHIVGLLSDRDLRLAAKLKEGDPSLSDTMVRDIMDRDVYRVTPQTSLSTVASHMVEHRQGAALVIHEDGHLIGIFTDLDAMRALAAHLHTQVPMPA
jgi:acetoin utilization protein AcuB